MIRILTETDTEAIAEIYNYYILNSVVTFEEEVIVANDILSRFERDSKLKLPWLVAEDEGKIIGFAYATKWNNRSAYRYTVETTVYLSSARTTTI